MNPRRSLAIGAGKLAGTASRALGRGGGTAIAGVAANNVDPGLVRALAPQLGHGCAIVTGTNGKTTTSSMLVAIAQAAGLQTLANPSGSNLMRGVAAALVEEASLSGAVRNAADRLGVFEVDEATVPEAARALSPRVIVFTNLFRDQLDRYGEVDTVAQRWRSVLPELPDTTIVLNVDDPAVASLAGEAPGPELTYGVEDTSVASDAELGLDHAADYRFCLSCGSELTYDAAFYGHVGHWRCGSCGRTRPAPDVAATSVQLSRDQSVLTLAHAGHEQNVALPLAGFYNVQNALAAAAAAFALGLAPDAVGRALTNFAPAFGRQERFDVDGREVVLYLAKNPTGVNQVLRTICADGVPDHFLMLLNDGIQDGRDISWIWDADFELLRAETRSVVVSGTRAEELALRLKYADVRATLVHDTERALASALESTPEGETLYVIPTYTAMMDVRERLANRANKQPFWERAS